MMIMSNYPGININFRRWITMPDNLDQNPYVSVVIPLYNGGNFIDATLHSVLAQSYKSVEVLIVDDGSADDGPLKVARIAERHPEKVRLLYHADHGNHGIAASRNLGIRSAKGVYVGFIDQDDIWLPQRLGKQIDAFEQFPDAGVVYGQCSYVDDEGNEIEMAGGTKTFGKGIAGPPQEIFRNLINEDIVPNLTVLVKKACLERVGLFDEGPRYEYEDWLLLSKLAFYYKFVFIPEVLAQWRSHSGNYSAQIFTSGKYSHAEENCTITLFSFLLNDPEIKPEDVLKYLRKRIWRFFLRSRSWGLPANELRIHAGNFQNAFPSEHLTIRMALGSAMMVHPKMASVLRRIRRKCIGT
jgi:glycosyltransferase involved in cell wall biosynthesis